MSADLFANLVGTALGASTASDALAQSGSFSPYTPINVAPVGVNLGEIFKDMSSGPPQNGGTPISMQWPISSFGTSSPLLDAVLDPEGNNDVSMPIFIAAGVIGVGAAIYYLARR